MASEVSALDRTMVARAVKLAARGWGRVEPNPYVGAVVLDAGGTVVGEAAHGSYGGPHAEVLALRRAGDAAVGATLYVTLEPCRHFGKTPPCDRLVRDRGIRRVVAGVLDPSAVSGGGLQWLAGEGLEVVRLPGPDAKALIAPFGAYLREDRPFVLAKWAMTLDGRIAARTGDSRYITSEPARRLVHRERARADAVLVGAGTVLADDPDLRPRLVRGRPAIRVVLDRRLRAPTKSNLVRTARETPTWILTRASPPAARARALERAGVRLISIGARATISVALRTLRKNGIHRVLVEGGADILGALFAAGAIDRVQAYVAPRLVGGARAVGPIGGGGAAQMAAAMNLVGVRTRRVGPDFLIEGDPADRSWGQRAGLLSGD